MEDHQIPSKSFFRNRIAYIMRSEGVSSERGSESEKTLVPAPLFTFFLAVFSLQVLRMIVNRRRSRYCFFFLIFQLVCYLVIIHARTH